MPVGQEVVLGARAPSFNRAQARFGPPSLAWIWLGSTTARDHSISPAARKRVNRTACKRPTPGALPLVQTSPTGSPGAELLGQMHPGAPSVEHEQDPRAAPLLRDGVVHPRPCRFILEGRVEASGHLLLRVEQTGQGFLAKDTFSFRTVLTNPKMSKWFVLHGQGVYHDIKATPVGGTITRSWRSRPASHS